MASSILLVRAFLLIYQMQQYNDGSFWFTCSDETERFCEILNVTPAYIDRILDFLLDNGLVTVEKDSVLPYLKLTADGIKAVEVGAISINQGGGADG